VSHTDRRYLNPDDREWNAQDRWQNHAEYMDELVAELLEALRRARAALVSRPFDPDYDPPLFEEFRALIARAEGTKGEG